MLTRAENLQLDAEHTAEQHAQQHDDTRSEQHNYEARVLDVLLLL